MPKFIILIDVDFWQAEIEADTIQDALRDMKSDWREYVNTVNVEAIPINEDGKQDWKNSSSITF